uniref:CCHC-type domain-containing protein n=1 Tax=Chrysemys picta bellii TaxID=8478 RepID=A0A8C3PDM2_CHRPI
MGQGQSTAGRARCTPLECILVNWKVFGSDPLIKSKLKRYFTVDWPRYQLEDQERWPPEGSLNYNTIFQLLLFCQRTGKWNEHMYAQLFMLLKDRSDLLQRCNLTPTGSVVTTVSPQNPPPVVMAESVSPSAPTPPPYKDRVPQVPEIAPSVGFYPLITETQIARPGAEHLQATTMQVYTHVPFNPVDLAAFKAQAGEFSTNPSKFISAFEGCLASHKPDWDDCNVLLRTLLSEVERNQVVSRAREEAQKRRDLNPIHVPTAAIQVPLADPGWNPNDPMGQTRLTVYKELLLHGLRHSAVRHNNWAKPYELVQEPKESPVAFLQCIRDTIRQTTNADPNERETEAIIKGIFTSRAAPDIKRKLQKKEDLMGMTMAQILETANRAYSLREGEKEKRQVKMMVAAVQAGGRGRFQEGGRGRGMRGRGRGRLGSQERRLGRNQCARCRKEGHWKNECPEREGTPMMAAEDQE